MATNPEVEPYVTLIPMVRSEVADLTIGTEVEENEFTDPQVAREINNAFLLNIRRDFSVPDAIVITDGNLIATILNDNKLTYALIKASAWRVLNIRLQSATANNIDVARSNKRITLSNLVRGLQIAVQSAKTAYQQSCFVGGVGLVPSVNPDGDGSALTHTEI